MKKEWDLKKEAVDQSAHLAVGFVVVVVLSYFMPLWVAAVIMLSIAFIRELMQHPDRKWNDLGVGSRLDMLFWVLGVALAVGLRMSGII